MTIAAWDGLLVRRVCRVGAAAVAAAFAVLGPPSSSRLAGQTTAVPWNAQVPLYGEDPSPESREYDFLIGDWDIVAKRYNIFDGSVISELRARQRTEYRNDGRMIVSEWTGFAPDTGQKVVHGVTLITYSPTTGQWQNTFLGSMQSGPASVFTTERVDDEIRGGGPTFRIRFFDITEDGYSWEQRITVDGGDTWILERTQQARRRPG